MTTVLSGSSGLCWTAARQQRVAGLRTRHGGRSGAAGGAAMDISCLLSPDDQPATQVSLPSPRSRPSSHHLPRDRHPPPSAADAPPPMPTPTSNPHPSPTPPARDVAMPDPPASASASASDSASPPADALGETDYAAIGELLNVVARSPYQAAAHMRLIALLHRGFRTSPDEAGRRALLPNLRRTREDAAKLFPLAEAVWLQWIADEAALAASFDERLAVIDICARAVEDQVASVRVWKAYADYVDAQRDTADPALSAEERALLRENFSLEFVLDTYRQGATQTQGDIADSHLLWDAFRDRLVHDLERDPSPAKVNAVYAAYKQRLATPHATLPDTFSAFSSFVTRHDNDNYESIMVSYNKLYAAASAKYSDREIMELRLRADNEADEWAAWAAYLEWEKSQPKKRLDVEMVCALYERCLLRFGEQANVWEDYVYFVLEKTNATPKVIKLLKRATRHCPWSGTLWAQYIIALERGFKPFEEVAEAKHLATRTELLDAGGLEELIKVNIAWCGFLQRRAFDADASEEDLDMAEMGIAEAVTGTGKEDPHYRLQRIQINFYTLAKKLPKARQIWDEIKKQYSRSYEFWLRRYEWELANGSKELAGNVIQEAVTAKDLDWPEKILDTWKSHVEDCGDVMDVEAMTVRYRKLYKEIQAKRQQVGAAAIDRRR